MHFTYIQVFSRMVEPFYLSVVYCGVPPDAHPEDFWPLCCPVWRFLLNSLQALIESLWVVFRKFSLHKLLDFIIIYF